MTKTELVHCGLELLIVGSGLTLVSLVGRGPRASQGAAGGVKFVQGLHG